LGTSVPGAALRLASHPAEREISYIVGRIAAVGCVSRPRGGSTSVGPPFLLVQLRYGLARLSAGKSGQSMPELALVFR